MIDYDKLKLAHELIDSLAKAEKESFELRIRFQVYDKSPIYELSDFHERDVLTYLCIDKLIAKLKELTKPHPKYKVGQELWWVEREYMKVISADVQCICTIDKRGVSYDMGSPIHSSIFERYLYPTRQALIEAQIKYWTDLKIQSISKSKICPECGMQRVADGMCWESGCGYKDPTESECNHASDGGLYYSSGQFICASDTFMDAPNDAKRKCKKCGEFYR